MKIGNLFLVGIRFPNSQAKSEIQLVTIIKLFGKTLDVIKVSDPNFT